MKPQQERARRTRRAILEAAMQRFGTDGYRGTSIASIAADAGMTDAGLLYHFPTKEALLFAVLVEHDAREQRTIDALTADPGDLVQKLREWGRHMEEVAAFTSLQAILSAEHMLDNSRINGYFRQRYEVVLQWLTDTFDSAKSQGQIATSTNTRSEAEVLLSVMDGARMLYFYTDGKVSIADVLRKHVDDMFSRIGS